MWNTTSGEMVKLSCMKYETLTLYIEIIVASIVQKTKSGTRWRTWEGQQCMRLLILHAGLYFWWKNSVERYVLWDVSNALTKCFPEKKLNDLKWKEIKRSSWKWWWFLLEDLWLLQGKVVLLLREVDCLLKWRERRTLHAILNKL